MSNLIPFAFEQHRIRIITRDGAPWFVLTDLCEVLEIANVGNAAARLKDSEKDAVRVADAIGRGATNRHRQRIRILPPCASLR